MYNTQIFSLAVLLSSLFVYNQVGVIDEAALDHLSLITEMTKHIHRIASEGKDIVSEFGHFSPTFIWLLRDFYLDLTEDNSKIKAHDYLELALKPVLGSGRDADAKNRIRESIRAVFPSRECFSLVRPLDNEADLQHLDQVSLDNYRPEFRPGFDSFANFVYERTRPKQVGDSMMTGPLLAGIAKSFLDVLNSSAAPIISFSWQVSTRDSLIETDLQCSNAIQSMEKKLQEACLTTDARVENVAMVLESLLSECEELIHGPTKWQKLFSFSQKSLQGPIRQHTQKQIDEASLNNSSLMLKCHSLENVIETLHKQLEASEKSKNEYHKCYEDAINDFKRLSDQYKRRIVDSDSKFSPLEESCSSSLEMLDSAKQETLEWKRRYEEMLMTTREANDKANNAGASHNSGICEAEARNSAAAEQFRLALKEASEWKEKYDLAISEAKAAREKAAELEKLMEENAAAAEQSRLALKEATELKEKYDIATNEVNAAREKAAEQAKLREEDAAAAAAEQSRQAFKEAKEWKEKHDIAMNEIEAAREKLIQLEKLKEEEASAAGERSRLVLEEATEWKEKYDIAISEAKADREKAVEQEKVMEKKVAATSDQSRLVLQEATGWKEKYDIAVNEVKAVREKADQRAKAIEEEVATAAEQSRLALQEATEWKEKYNIAISEAKANREKTVEQAKVIEKEVAAASEQSRLALQEAREWKEKYDIAVHEVKAVREKADQRAKIIEEEVAAAAEQSRLALQEAKERKEKYEIDINEAKAAREKAAEQEKVMEEDLRTKLAKILSDKDEEMKDKTAKLEEAEQRITTLNLDLKAAEAKVENYVFESSALKFQLKQLADKYNSVKAAALLTESEVKSLMEDKIQLEKTYMSELKRFEETHESREIANEQVKVTNEFIEAAQSEALALEEEKHNSHPLATDRLHTQIPEGEKVDRTGEFNRSATLEGCAMSKITLLEAMVRERDEEIELLKKKNEQCVNAVPTPQNNFKSELAAEIEEKKMEKELLEQESTPYHSYGYAKSSVLKTLSGRKRSNLEVSDTSFYSVKMETREEFSMEMKKPKSSSALAKCTTSEIDSVFKTSEEDGECEKTASADYTKVSMWKLRQELNERGFGQEVQKLRHPKKAEIVALYEKFILKK
ncbi:uncharacterized protein LOC126657734 isoform X2 [Mercurialis annua]|nr:uncharacterized protein LOC126657734 isoform X2 [Mercurialis annua]XP_050208443.1 uncharacterized protein LOC126657734 isoform X2 [Mercurialis annua]